jgi:hypothetical protein
MVRGVVGVALKSLKSPDVVAEVGAGKPFGFGEIDEDSVNRRAVEAARAERFEHFGVTRGLALRADMLEYRNTAIRGAVARSPTPRRSRRFSRACAFA